MYSILMGSKRIRLATLSPSSMAPKKVVESNQNLFLSPKEFEKEVYMEIIVMFYLLNML